MQKISRPQKMLIGIILILLAGIGLYFAQNKQNKPAINANINSNNNTNKPAVVDPSTWELYSEPAMGIEFNHPSEWDGGTTAIGTGTGEGPFWQEDILGRSFWSGGSPDSLINLSLIVKKSNLSLDDFWAVGEGMGITGKTVHIEIGGLPAIVDESSLGNGPSYEKILNWSMVKDILIKSNDTFYFFEFGASGVQREKAQHEIENFDKVISTMKFSQPLK